MEISSGGLNQMFRPGKPKDEPEPPQPQPQQPAPAHTPNEDTQQRYRASETTSTGVRGSMNDGQANSGKAYTESDALARDIKEGTLTGFVGNGTNMTGEANFKGMLRVDGHLSGRVSSVDGTLIVSTGGQVDANVEVSVAQIYGTVNGDVIASKRIELGRVAKVNGNIQTPALVIEQGAIFEGSCRMQELRDEQTKAESRAATVTGTSGATSTTATPGTTGTGGNGKTDATKPASGISSSSSSPATSSATSSTSPSSSTSGSSSPSTTGSPKPTTPTT
jgi:cytoskeletal protein CcmA (bactofilin family)